jgi:hypothetical protein
MQFGVKSICIAATQLLSVQGLGLELKVSGTKK